MLLRIGVNVGGCDVEGSDVFGEVVNVAAPRGDRRTWRNLHLPCLLCSDQANSLFTDLGEQRLKNIADPVRTCAVRPIVGSADRREVKSGDVVPFSGSRRAGS
jgi:class 3 adenylate cyclase